MINLNRQRTAIYLYFIIVFAIIFGLSFTVQGDKISGGAIFNISKEIYGQTLSANTVWILFGFLSAMVFILFIIKHIENRNGTYLKKLKIITVLIVILLFVSFSGIGIYTHKSIDSQTPITGNAISDFEEVKLENDNAYPTSLITGYATAKTEDYSVDDKKYRATNLGNREWQVNEIDDGKLGRLVEPTTKAFFLGGRELNLLNEWRDPDKYSFDTQNCCFKKPDGGFVGYKYTAGGIFGISPETFEVIIGPNLDIMMVQTGFAKIPKNIVGGFLPSSEPINFGTSQKPLYAAYLPDGTIYQYDPNNKNIDFNKEIKIDDPIFAKVHTDHIKDWKDAGKALDGSRMAFDTLGNVRITRSDGGVYVAKQDDHDYALAKKNIGEFKEVEVDDSEYDIFSDRIYIDLVHGTARACAQTCSTSGLTPLNAEYFDSVNYFVTETEKGKEYKINPNNPLEIYTEKDGIYSKVDLKTDLDAISALSDSRFGFQVDLDSGTYISISGNDGKTINYKISDGKLDSLVNDKKINKKIIDRKKFDLDIRQKINNNAQDLFRNLLNLIIGDVQSELLQSVCEEEESYSEPRSSTPQHFTGSTPFVSPNEQPNNCQNELTTATAQAQKSTLAAGFTYQTSWTITPCKQNIEYAIYLANTISDRIAIANGVANKALTKSESKQFSYTKDYQQICIQVSDNSIGDNGYACFNII